MPRARRGGLLVLTIALFAVAVACLHLEAQRRLRHHRDVLVVRQEPHQLDGSQHKQTVVSSGHKQKQHIRVPAKPGTRSPRQRGSDSCSSGDSDCVMAHIRSQLSFTGVGDGGCTSTDRDCKEEYSQWLTSSAKIGALPSAVHLSFAQPQTDSALSAQGGALVLSWTTSSDVLSECSTATIQLQTEVHTSATARKLLGSARHSTSGIVEHCVELEGLLPGEWYRYRVGCDAFGWSEEKILRAPGGALSRDGSWSFLATSDTGSTRAAREVFLAMAAESMPLDGKEEVNAQTPTVWFALHGGDASYGMDAAAPAKRAAMASGFFIAAEPLASVVPMAIALGNHDMRMFQSSTDSSVGDGTSPTPYLLRPGHGQKAASAALYYTFTLGGVRIVVLNTDEPYQSGSVQYTWLQNQMQMANTAASRIECPWLVIQMHRPMYSASPWYENTREAGATGTAGDLTSNLEPLFAEGGVDLVLGGHVHGYERTHATGRNGSAVMHPARRQRQEEVDCYSSPGHPVYINVGMGGAGSLGQFKGKPALTSLAKSRWNAVSLDAGYGYVQVTVSNPESSGTSELFIEYHDIGERRFQPWQQLTPQRQPPAILDRVLLVKEIQ